MKQIKCMNCDGNLNTNNSYGIQVKCEYCGTSHLLENPLTKYGYNQFGEFRNKLSALMQLYFTLDDIRNLCSMVYNSTNGLADYNDLRGSTKTSKINEYIDYGRRRGILELMVQVGMEYNREFALAMELYFDTLEVAVKRI